MGFIFTSEETFSTEWLCSQPASPTINGIKTQLIRHVNENSTLIAYAPSFRLIVVRVGNRCQTDRGAIMHMYKFPVVCVPKLWRVQCGAFMGTHQPNRAKVKVYEYVFQSEECPTFLRLLMFVIALDFCKMVFYQSASWR